MRMMTFAKRCAKEILRDPINLAFGLGFPLVLLVLLSAIQANIPVSLFEINTLTPGITVFGLSFITLFSATLIAKQITPVAIAIISDGNGINNVYGNFESQRNRKQIADHGLTDCNGQNRKHISHNKVKSRKWSSI